MSSIISSPRRRPPKRRSIRWRTSASKKIQRRAWKRRRWWRMLSPRWRKVLRDLWSNKTRTILVVLSIAVGVFAVGMIAGSRVMLQRDLAAAYADSRPYNATLYTSWFDDD